MFRSAHMSFGESINLLYSIIYTLTCTTEYYTFNKGFTLIRVPSIVIPTSICMARTESLAYATTVIHRLMASIMEIVSGSSM